MLLHKACLHSQQVVGCGSLAVFSCLLISANCHHRIRNEMEWE